MIIITGSSYPVRNSAMLLLHNGKHTYTLIYTHTHTYTHTYTWTYIRARTHTKRCDHIHTYTYIHAHVHIHTLDTHIPYPHIQIHTYTHTCTYIDIHTQSLWERIFHCAINASRNCGPDNWIHLSGPQFRDAFIAQWKMRSHTHTHVYKQM